ncbi:MAG TPA: hypothetical protein VFH56_14400 [Acidimicrobiales bacterium]|nr:hypothetical protein [Acidimicrobiales bacterium]
MATFDPPRNHWDENFGARLTGSLEWLREQVEATQKRVTGLERELRAKDEELRAAVSDAKFWANKARGNE